LLLLILKIRYGGHLRAEPLSIGSKVLLAHIPRIDPILHLFGHEHDSRGVLQRDGRLFVNASAVEGDRGILAQGGHYVQKQNFVPTVVDFRLN
jgi:Icc-related predicted phosphoesterase